MVYCENEFFIDVQKGYVIFIIWIKNSEAFEIDLTNYMVCFAKKDIPHLHNLTSVDGQLSISSL